MGEEGKVFGAVDAGVDDGLWEQDPLHHVATPWGIRAIETIQFMFGESFLSLPMSDQPMLICGAPGTASEIASIDGE